MKKNIISLTAAAVAGVTLVSCASTGTATLEVTQGTVIRNVTVVNTRDGSLMPGMTVIVEHGKIQQVAAIGSIHTSGSARLIDASGKYLVPGFLDMHTHAMPGVDKQPAVWPLLIANGITGIRDMAGSAEMIQRAKRLNADSAAGRVDAPEIELIPGDLFVAATSPSLAVQQVQKQKAMGASFIKIVSANHDATLAILAEAKNQGLPVAGHLPPSVSAEEASRAGWRAMEHLGSGIGFLIDCSSDEAGVRRSILSGEGKIPEFSPKFIKSPVLNRALDEPLYRRVLNTYSHDKCQALAKTFATNETWQIPTLIRMRTIITNAPLYRANPNLVYVDKPTRAMWEGLAADYPAYVPAKASATFQEFYELQKKVVRLLKENGVKMLTGTDLGGIWVIPGFALHDEFHELAASGLSPLEILQMTTLNGAQFLHKEATMGTVDAGKNADLVMLDANPMADVANLDKISGVFLKGKYFSKEDLEDLKKNVALAYSKQPVSKPGPAAAPDHVD